MAPRNRFPPRIAMTSRDDARRIATEYLSEWASPWGPAYVWEVLAWDEITWARPRPYGAQASVETTWICNLDEPQAPLMLRSSTIIAVSRVTGQVVYAGSANDEG
jgi:hypothetical protein